MIRNGKAIDHSNHGGVWGSLIAWLVAFAALVGAIYAMGWWTFDNVWLPGLIAMTLATLALALPKAVLGRSDTVDTVAIHTQHPVEVGSSHAAGRLHH